MSIFVIVPLFYALQYYLYFRAVKIFIKRDQEITNDKTIQVNLIVTNDCIQNSSSIGGVNNIPFYKIKKVVQTKHLILLRSEANLLYIFCKASFAKGSTSGFIAFLNQKELKIKQ